MGWTAGIDFENANLEEFRSIFSDLLKAVNERCDAANINRPFWIDDGNPDTTYSGSITSITVIDNTGYSATNRNSGIIRIYEGNSYDSFPYTAVSGSGSTKTYTVSTTLSGIYTTAADVEIITIDPDNLPLWDIGEIVLAIDNRIDNLIPRFANHTTATGVKFVGLDTIDQWTESTLLTHIGDASRVKGRLVEPKDWISQVYRIVNALKWVFKSRVVSGSQDFILIDLSSTSALKNVYGVTWNDVVTNWPADFTSTTSNVATEYFSSYDSNGYFLGDTNRRQGRAVSDVGYRYYLGSFDINYEADLYFYTVSPRSEPFNSPYSGSTYNNHGKTDLQENKYGLFMSNTITNDNTGIFDMNAEINAMGVPDEPPATPDPNYYGFGAATAVGNAFELYYISGKARIAIFRFDVTGGFEYL